jgi:hypothetical protein
MPGRSALSICGGTAAEILNIKIGGTYSYHCVLKGYNNGPCLNLRKLYINFAMHVCVYVYVYVLDPELLCGSRDEDCWYISCWWCGKSNC